jgi:hypothetical protein
MKINIIEINKNLFDVNIEDKVKTTHTIELDDTYHLKLSTGKLEKKQLILLSIQFLLIREPNTAILSSFELQLISTYFTEFENEIIVKIKELEK